VDLFFLISKTVTLVLIPGNFIVLLFIAAAGLASFARTRRWGLRVGIGACALLLSIAVLPVGPLLLRSLEQRFPSLEDCPAQLAQPIAGIILLGGGVSSGLINGKTVDGVNDASDRVWLAADLAHRYPDARLIVSGGQAIENGTGRPEADATTMLLERLGVPQNQIVLERVSRSTAENAALSKRSVGPGAWIVITSAFHMPRAVGAFRKAGMLVIAAPTDWRATDGASLFEFDAVSNVLATNLAAKELLGLAGYWISSRSDELLPGPEPGCDGDTATATSEAE
jgi:uncharacterized SAM-binding protein YcdF (DUF218 family)